MRIGEGDDLDRPIAGGLKSNRPLNGSMGDNGTEGKSGAGEDDAGQKSHTEKDHPAGTAGQKEPRPALDAMEHSPKRGLRHP